MNTLTTDRLVLRNWHESDAPSLFKYASDPLLGPRAGWAPHQSEQESLDTIRTIFAQEGMWAVELKETAEVIGCVGYLTHEHSNLDISEDECEVGYWIARPYWNLGICTEALKTIVDYCFYTKGFTTLWGDYFPDNPASGKVMTKCGFIDTGIEKRCPTLDVGADKPVRVLKYVRPRKIQLIRITHSDDPLLKNVLELYESAFPENERTGNEQFLAMIDHCPQMSFNVISEHDQLDGMAVIWDLGICRYLLYLAVTEKQRNHGLGAETLRLLKQQSSLPIIGEIEYASEDNPMAARRIGFYQRNGFSIASDDPKILNSSHYYDSCHLMLIASQPLSDIDECQRRVVEVVYKSMHAQY